VLQHRIGERFRAVVLASDPRGAQIQIDEPPVIARLDDGAPPGAHLEVELTGADPTTRAITFRTSAKARG
jgi:hypothetical protein